MLGVLVPFSSSDGATEITYTQELFHFSPNVPDKIGQSIIPLGRHLIINYAQQAAVTAEEEEEEERGGGDLAGLTTAPQFCA